MILVVVVVVVDIYVGCGTTKVLRVILSVHLLFLNNTKSFNAKNIISCVIKSDVVYSNIREVRLIFIREHCFEPFYVFPLILIKRLVAGQDVHSCRLRSCSSVTDTGRTYFDGVWWNCASWGWWLRVTQFIRWPMGQRKLLNKNRTSWINFDGVHKNWEFY